MSSESALRLGFFVGVWVLMTLAESLFPRRERQAPGFRRMANNLGVSFLSSLLLRLAFPMLPYGAALWCETQGFGLFNALSIPAILDFPLSFLLLDLAIYWQHVFSHQWRPFWMLHRMHHADTGIDAATGVRFHPFEIAISALWKLTLVFSLGLNAEAVLVFEIALNACSLFNHANVALPKRVDAKLRRVLVTPDMHRVHHSVNPEEFNTNYGFCLSFWDRLFGSYTPQPALGHTRMEIGLRIFRHPRYLGFLRMLTIPFDRNPL